MPKTDPYNKHTDKYEDWFSRNRFTYESELQAVRLMLPQGGIGMEIGVGTGRFAGPLGITIGIEPSKSMREFARKRGVDVIDGIAEALPFPDSKFDFVLMVTVLCFLDDVVSSLQEAYRVLKPSGSLVIGFIDRNSPVGKIYDASKEVSTFYGEATFYSAQEVSSFLKSTGFRKLAFSQAIFQDDSGIGDIEPVREGHGEGCFVVVRATK